MIDKHSFPRDYAFDMINTGVKGRISLLNGGKPRRPTGHAAQNQQSHKSRTGGPKTKLDIGTKEDENAKKEEEVDDRSKALGATGSRRRASSAAVMTGDSKVPADAGITNLAPLDGDQKKTSKDPDVDGLTTSMSALKFVPHSVQVSKENKPRK